MFEAAQALAARLTTVRDEEAARIAREVHDEFGQALTTLGLDVGWLRQKLEAGPLPAGELAAKLSSMSQVLDTAMDLVNRITTELRPAILDKLGIEAAIDWHVEELARRTGISYRVRSDLQGRSLDPARSTALFRILQEALNNVTRHAGATTVDIGLRVVENRVVLEVVDDGKGIPEGKIEDPRSLGILGMRDRARSLGGDLQIRRGSDHGTVVQATIPL
jgi:two-component system sensor histidine kinase UhpB